VSFLLMILRAAFAQRLIGAAKAAASRGGRAGLLVFLAAALGFFAVCLAIVAGVIALSEMMSPVLAVAAVGLLFLVAAGVTAVLAGKAVKRVTEPGAAVVPVQNGPGFALSPQTIEVLVACAVAVILGVVAGRANHAGSKPPE
jgi:threonine/homoserine/homoserine lactone efflux protein